MLVTPVYLIYFLVLLSPGSLWRLRYREKDWGKDWPFHVMGRKVSKQKVPGMLWNASVQFHCYFMWWFNHHFVWLHVPSTLLNFPLMWQICLSFYETKNKHMAWFVKVERLYWEQWFIQLNVIPPAPSQTKSYYDSSQSVDTGGESPFDYHDHPWFLLLLMILLNCMLGFRTQVGKIILVILVCKFGLSLWLAHLLMFVWLVMLW